MDGPTLNDRLKVEGKFSERKFVWLLALTAIVLAVLPALLAVLTTPAGARYVGFQYATDDHMVYSAWMRQAMDGHFFFDNRFTTDPQPGLTVHIYFFLLGLIAKVTGIAFASNLARLGFSGLFVWLCYLLVRRLEWEVYAAKLAVTLTIVGGGLGFLVWHNFGQAIVKPSPLSGILMNRLPIDVWQPEGFVFPSMLTNGLFMVSLCLILTSFLAFLSAKENKRSVWLGMISLGVLMNIHSYDVLLIAFAMVGFLAASLVQRQVTGAWLGRAALIVCGVIPAALWFMHVLQVDTVFQSRAATETYTPNFRQVFFGYLPLMVLAFAGAWHRIARPPAEKGPHTSRRLAGVGLAVLIFLGMFAAAANHNEGYFMAMPAFAATFLLAVVAVALASDENPAWNLVFSWAVVGTVGIYFPGLFQRKLTMGLSIPWAILAAYGLYGLLHRQERSTRNLLLSLAIIVLGASSVRWLLRETKLISSNVSNTVRHPVYLSKDVRAIIDYLNKTPGKKVVLAFPGTMSPAADAEGKAIPDEFVSPALPDLAPFASGLAGAYTYAGHWSETPNYPQKAKQMSAFFLRDKMSDEQRLELEHSIGANYAILPVQESYPEIPLVSAAQLGETVVAGSQFSLVKLR